MTDNAVTDGDLRNARLWAEKVGPPYTSPGYIGTPSEIYNVARVILANVEAPAPTLAERLQYRADILDNGDPDGDTSQALRDLATAAAQMEHDLAEARAEMDQWKLVSRIETTTLREQRDEAHADLADVTEVNHEIRRERDEARAEIVRCREVIRKHKEQTDRAAGERDEALAEVERLTDVNEELRKTDNYREFRDKFLTVQKDAESNAESPDPADVKPGEAWLVRDEQELSVAVRDAERWVLIRLNDATIRYRRIQHITLITRLVPAPRVIADPDELDRLPFRAVILSTDKQADVYQKDSNGEWMDVTSYGHSSREVIRIENAVTVLREDQE